MTIKYRNSLGTITSLGSTVSSLNLITEVFLEFGHFIIVGVTYDPYTGDNTGEQNGHASLSGLGITWERLGESIYGSGAAGAGVVTELWFGKVPVDITVNPGATLTITLDGPNAHVIVGASDFTTDFGNAARIATLFLPNPIEEAISNVTGYPSMTFTGNDDERLFFRSIGKEQATTNPMTETAGFTKVWDLRSNVDGDGSVTNIIAKAEMIVASTSTVTSDPISSTVAANYVGIFAAIEEYPIPPSPIINGDNTMGQTKTNDFTMSYAIESAVPGVLPVSPEWKVVEPNSIPTFGTDVTMVSRQPISKRRQKRKGKTTDLSSAVEIEMDFTLDPFEDMIGFFSVAAWHNKAPQRVLSCDANSFTTADSNITYPVGSLVHVRGMLTAVNNGLHLVNGSPSDVDTPVTTTLTVEASPANAIIERAGIRAAAGDLEVNSSGNLISTTLDFTTLPIVAGQAIWIGGASPTNQFFQQANTDTNYGYARIVSIAAHVLVLDKTSTVFVADDGTSTGAGGVDKAIDLYFGRFVRDVSTDDAFYRETSVQFEGGYKNLDTDGDTMYEYPIGNFANEATFELPETNKATMKFGFVGIDTDLPTQTRKTNAATALEPIRTDSMSTSTDIARLRMVDVDDNGMSTCFKKLTLSLKNNVEPEKCLGTLGSPYLNLGNYDVRIETTVMFTNAGVIAAIRNSETLSFDFVLDNDDGAVFFDIPALTLGGGKREFPINKTITIALTGEAFGDPVFDASLMVSTFPYVPTI